MQMTRNVFRKYGPKLAAVPALLMVGVANAAVDAEITTAMATAKTDVSTISAAVLLVFVAIFGFKILKRAF